MGRSLLNLVLDHGSDDDKRWGGEGHMDTGSQFGQGMNWGTTGMDSDYEEIDPSTGGGTVVEYEPLNFPQATGSSPHSNHIPRAPLCSKTCGYT